jgi:hypothetical protein
VGGASNSRMRHNPLVKGFVMVERAKSLDYRARQAKAIGKASDDLLD